MLPDEDITQPDTCKSSFKSIVSVLSYCVKSRVNEVASSFLKSLDWHYPMVGSYSIVDSNFVADKDSTVSVDLLYKRKAWLHVFPRY